MFRLVIILVCFWYAPARAESYVVVSQSFNYYPHYNFKSESDKGLIWAILQEFSAFSGHTFVYLHMPVLRLQKELEKGTIDLVYPDNPLFNNNQRFAKDKYYSDTVVQTIGGTMVNSAKFDEGIDAIKQLAIPLGFTPQLGWEKLLNAKKLKLVQVSTPLAGLQLLNLGRVDATDVDYFVSRYQLHNHPELRKLAFHPDLPHSVVEFKLSTVKQPQLIDEINHFMETQPQVIKELKARFGISSAELVLQNLKETVIRR